MDIPGKAINNVHVGVGMNRPNKQEIIFKNYHNKVI